MITKLFHNNQEIGFFEYTLAADEAQIIDIFIAEPFRRQGHGAKTLENFINEVKDKYTYIILEVRKSNIPAITLYKKMGFEKMYERKNYYTNPVEDAIVMKKLT